MPGPREVLRSLGARWALADSPICTVERRLAILEKVMGFFGWDTQRPGWRPGPMLVATVATIAISLASDVRKATRMLERGNETDVKDVVETLVFILTQAVCCYRIYLLLSSGRKNRAIIGKLVAEFCEWLTTEERRATMRKSSRHGWFIFKVDTAILSMTTLFFITRTIIGHTLMTPASGLALPYVDNELSPYYEILYCLQVWIITAQIAMALTMNNLFCTLVAMICGHLDCLAVDVDELDDRHDDETTFRKLDAIIKKYIKIDNVVTDINNLYGTQLGLQPLYTGAVIITSTLLYDGDQQSNVFLQISFDHIMELFIYCYIGDLVYQKSAALSLRLYSTSWITMNQSHKKIILQMMHRCQKPFTFRAGLFGPLTMEMYSKSMQMTYSMWTVFNGRALRK